MPMPPERRDGRAPRCFDGYGKKPEQFRERADDEHVNESHSVNPSCACSESRRRGCRLIQSRASFAHRAIND